MLVGFVSAVVLCVSTLAQAEMSGNSAAQDLLIKSEVETAVSMLQAIYAKHQQGEMTLEKAKKLGADLLRELRYGTGGYFWADTTEGVNVVLYGRKDMEGRNRLEDKDSTGWNLLTLLYSNILIYPYEVKRMGKTARNRVQIGVANVEDWATTYTCGTIADRDRYSASARIGI